MKYKIEVSVLHDPNDSAKYGSQETIYEQVVTHVSLWEIIKATNKPEVYSQASNYGLGVATIPATNN